ncbi:hypothetical protein [Pendulispora albinea]|uniref:PKD domain-containing protein n=1 Tax=Pendulispora albinea TaxID=2741071 RepID=A0ABZ2LYM4_9BACT
MALFIGCSGGSGPGGTSNEEPAPENTSASKSDRAPPVAAAAGKKDITVDMLVPSDVSISELALVGAEVDVGERARILTPHARYATVANVGMVGSATTLIGASAETGSLYSVGNVSLRDGAFVHGRLRTAGRVQGAGRFTVDSGVEELRPVPTRHLIRRATFGAMGGSVVVAAGQKREAPVSPGSYDTLRLGKGAQATLLGGNYAFRSVVLESGSTLRIDNTQGAVYLYVERELDHAGTIVEAKGGYPRWLVSYVGSGTVFLRSPFAGSVIAPNGTIQLDGHGAPSGRHEGAFFGRAVHVGPDAEIRLHDFPWIIRGVQVDKPLVCSGDSVHVKVDAPEPAAPEQPAKVSIDGMPLGELYDQVQSAPGKHMYSVTAVAADGTKESHVTEVDVSGCPTTTPVLPKLFAQENMYHPDTVDLAVVNAAAFPGADTVYDWSFGDGASLSTSLASVSHDYANAVPVDLEHKAFDVSVTVRRSGASPVTAKRTFVVWSTYGIARARGTIEPPAMPIDPQFRIVSGAAGSEAMGEVQFENRESEALTYTQRRVDQVPCKPDDAIVYGANEPVSVSVPPKAKVTDTLRVAQASLSGSSCGVTVHYWGATSKGLKARTSVHFERPSAVGQGLPVPDQMAHLLNYVADKGLATNPHRISEEEIAKVYRERKLPSSAVDYVPPNTPLTSLVERVPCDPDNPGAPPQPGFSCQPTGRWEGTGPGDQPLEEHIQNALKGDTILVRSCTGMVSPLLGAVDPPQKFTHSGIMTKHRFEITHSTGEDDYLVKEHPSGVFGQPTDGFQEQALRYLWPGTVTASVREAFAGDGRPVQTPEGKPWKIRGFERLQVRCPGDAQIVYPRVLKPPPEFEAATRPKLMAAADAAKTLHGHYRFHAYSSAHDTDAPDPNGPQPIPDASGREPLYGQTPTVCSSFVRLALKKAGFELDHDKSFPKPSDVRNNPPDGIFFYDVDERKHAGNVLYTGLYNTVQYQLSQAASGLVDEAWWLGTRPYEGGLWGNGAAFVSGAFALLGPVAGWATDAPDDIGNQITNCFAFDYCSEEAKDSDAWKEPGNGFAVSPDNLLDHLDSPATGGPYGYSERMIYRGKDYRPIFEWRPNLGSLPLNVMVATPEGAATAFAQVEVRGFTLNPLSTNFFGRVLIEGVPRGNIMLHAQKYIGDELREGDACYVPADPGNPSSQTLRLVDCSDFGRYLDNVVRTEALVTLKPPRAEFRNVVFDAQVDLKDCDCLSEDEWSHPVLHRVCVVNPLHRDDDVWMDPGELCSDEVGLRFHAHCQLKPDNRTVHVWLDYWFYESTSPTCGGNDLEDERHREYDAPPDQTMYPPTETLNNSGQCAFSSCNDFATIRSFSFHNRRAD